MGDTTSRSSSELRWPPTPDQWAAVNDELNKIYRLLKNGTIGNGTNATVADTGVVPGSYGSASRTVTETVQSDGRLSVVSDQAIAIAASQVTSGALALARGGLGADVSSIAKGGVFAGTGAGAIGITTVGSDGQVLMADAASTGGVKWTPLSPVYAVAENVNAFTVTHSVFNTITWDTNVVDSGSVHSTSVNPSRFTVPTGASGVYAIGCAIFITSTNAETAQYLLRPLVNGSVIDGGVTILFSPGGGQNMGLNGSTLVKLNAGDYVEWQIEAVSANNQTILAVASPNYYNPRAWLVKVGSLGTNKIVQVVHTETGAVAIGTTTIPLDDTIPQNTEGDQYMSLSITPTNASNTLKIEVVAQLSHTVANTWLTAALFQDSTANALAAQMETSPSANGNVLVSFTHYMSAGTTSATTFKVRCGGNGAGTVTFNGRISARLYGGVLASSITITEIGA